MVVVMHVPKACFSLVLVMALCAAVSPELSHVQSVYILPMTNGMDQYLANTLSREGVLRVVTNPKQADAILTESLGPGFEEKMDELYPPPPEAAPPAAAAKADKAEKSDKEKRDKKEGKTPAEEPPAFGTFKGEDNPHDIFRPKTSSWSRGKGNFFVVQRVSRAVIWSAFEKPKDTRPHSLNHSAAIIVGRLKKDLGRQ